MEKAEDRVPSTQPRHVGDRLRIAREAKGISLEDVAARTRVPLRHLQAIEDGRYGPEATDPGYGEGLPVLTYTIGFARAYAQAVGLDPTQITREFRAEANPDPEPERVDYAPVDVARVPSWRLAIGAAVLAMILAVGLFLWRSDGGGGNEPLVAEGASPAASIAQEPPPEEDSASPAEASVPAAAPTSAAPAGPVVLTAEDDVWLKVYDRDNQSIRQGTMAKGEHWTVPGDPSQLMLWTGRAGAITITVGGQAVPSLGGPAETVRNVSLDPASLLARARSGPASPLPAAPSANPATPPA